MNNFKGGFKKGSSRFGGKKNFSRTKHRDGGHQREHRANTTGTEMFSATCSECHSKCEVPFRPSGDKPVYCSNCFGVKKNANEPRGSFVDRGAREQTTQTERTLNTKPPRDQRSPRHDPTRGRGNDDLADLKRQITGLELKLNRILELINPPLPAAKPNTPLTDDTPLKTTVKKVTKTVTLKTTPKKAAKKVAKAAPAKQVTKTAPKKTAKKVTPKATIKKVIKKVAKKVAAKKAIKKAKK